MAWSFNVPDEFVRGLVESARTFWLKAGSQHELQTRYWQQQFVLWGGIATGTVEPTRQPVASPERGDRRFNSAAWRDNPYFDLIKQSYLINARLITDLVETVEVDDKTRQRLRFYTRQFADSMSPANFPMTNPDAIRLAFESNGDSVKAGIANLLADLRKGRISITDETAFEVGRNVAVSPGAVVFENRLFQLLQYAPRTEQVAMRPLLIVPPCINKFYILDLQPENSLVRYACEQGHTVLLVSWRNPGEESAGVTWDDYVGDGVTKAIEVALAIARADKLNALGWCVGGTILSSALAVLRARSNDSVASVTLLTTMLDFEEPGDLGVFIDEQGVATREQTIGQRGIYSGHELGFVFQTLRANDLIWSSVVANYLKGQSPEAFDMLYWNADITNLPGPMYAWYLRHMYLENSLRVPNRLTMCGAQVDLGKIDMPSYVLAAQEDHIVPWKSAYRTTQLFGGKMQFVLAESGHIAGVINPASKNKRSYWADGTHVNDAEAWLRSARATPGSWWPHWSSWLALHAGKTVDARHRLGNRKYQAIEPAPGRYVKERAS